MANEGYLTTHVLDTMRGCPAGGLSIELFEINEGARIKLKSALTNADGRCDSPILGKENFKAGTYELLFHVGDYFAANNIAEENGKFLDIVPVRFIISDEGAHYHVPLLLSPYGYSTYRGS